MNLSHAIAYYNPYIAELFKTTPPRYSWPKAKSQAKKRKEKKRKCSKT